MNRSLSQRQWSAIKVVLFIACLLPLALLLWRLWQHQLGANPIEKLSHGTGDWTFNFLLITLAVTPLRFIFGWNFLMRFRRMLGLYTFFYATLHFANWLVIDQFFDWADIVKDIAKRPYVTVGFVGYLLLIPLAVTSTNAMIRRLGRARWRTLHQAAYAVAVLGCLHYFWLTKADNYYPWIYTVLTLLLLAYRRWGERLSAALGR